MANRFKVQTTPKAKAKVNRFIVAPQTTKTTTTTPKTTPKAPALQPGMSTATIEKQNAAAFAKFGVKAPAGAPRMSIPPTMGGPKIGYEFKYKDVWGDNYITPRADLSGDKFRQTIAGAKPLRDLFGNAAGQVNHVTPVPLGGTGSKKETANLDWREDKRSLLQKILKSDISFTKAQQSGRVLVEIANIKDFKDGKITQGQAIANILAWDEANGQGKANQLKRTNPALASQIKTQAGQINNKFFPDSDDIKLAKAIDDKTPLTNKEILSLGMGPFNPKNLDIKTVRTTLAQYGLTDTISAYKGEFPKEDIKTRLKAIDDDVQNYYRQKKREETFKKEGVTGREQVAKDYKEPESFSGTLLESAKRGYYSILKPAAGATMEMIGQTVGSPEMIKKGQALNDKSLAEFAKRPDLLPAQDIKNIWQQATSLDFDARYYGKVVGEMIPMLTTAIAGGVIAGPVGAGAVIYSTESSNVYNSLIDEGVAPDKAGKAAEVYGAIATILENLGVSPSKVAGMITGKSKVKILNSIKDFVVKTSLTAIGGGVEESSQQFTENAVKKYFNEDQKLSEGLAESFMAGLVGEGLIGGAIDSGFSGWNVIKDPKVAAKLKDVAKNTEGFARIPGEQTKVVDNLQLAEKGVERVLNDFATKVDYRISGEFNKTTEIGNKIRSVMLGEVDSPGKLYSSLKEVVDSLDIAPDLKTKITESLKESVGDYFTMLKGGETSTLGYEKVSETPSQEKSKVKTVNFEEISTGLMAELDAKANLQTAKIKQYEEEIKAGKVAPPIPVYEENGKYILNKDGFNRFTAQRNLGITDIKIEVQPKTALSASAKQKQELAKINDPLSQEAAKYKTSDEFIKAQGKPILHGTNEKFGKFDTSKLGTNEKDLAARNAFFFTDSLETAKSYGDNVMEAYGNFKNPITIDAEGKMYGDMRDQINDAVLKAKKDGNDVVIVKNLSDRKDWGNYEPATHYAVIDTNKLLTKAELIDIWNKAQQPNAGKEETKIDAKQFVEAQKYKRNKLKEALEGPLGDKKASEIEFNQYERSQIDPSVVAAIKKTPFYRKEKGVLDIMGEGIFYVAPGSKSMSLAYTKEQIKRAKAIAKDYYEVDSMATTYGFETGYEFLVDQLEKSERPRTTNLKTVVDQELMKTDKAYEKAIEITEGVKGKTVKLSTYLNEKAFSDKIKARRERLEAIRDYLQLSDDDVRRISRKDIRFMNDYEFEQFLKNFDSMAVKYAETKQAKLELLALINDREFKNWDNLRQANGFKKIDEMSVAELRAFEKALEPYQFGDEFLSIRKLETIDNTDLVGLKTLREVKQRLAEDIGISVENFDKIEVSFLDKFKGDTTLARKNAFFNFMVDEYNKSKLQNDYDYLEFEKQLDELGRAAEKSVGLTLGEKIVPQQKIVMAYLETTEANRLILAEKMTKAEIDLAVFLQNEYQKALAYLIQQKALFSSRFDGNYFVHIRRGILEEIKEDGIVSAVKNIFSQYKENEQNFKILDDDTQNILPLEKFFKFSLFRSGGIKPTQNVIEASKAYFRMLYTKKALDSMIPKVDIYAQVLTPKEMTPHGLEMDRSLKKFVNEWVNNKKGRKTSFGGVITQGGPADIALRTTKMFTSLLDLGLNLPVSIATYIGEATAQFPLLGAKNYSLGIFRKQTEKGKRILAKYQNFTGRSAWDSLIAPGQGLFDRSLNGIFIGFRDSSHRANTFYLLGSMTRQEFMSEKISDERLSELKKNLGKYRIVEGAKSIIGSTSFGSAATQYKSWAIPIFSTTINNFKNIIANKELRGQSATELVRTLEILAIPLIIGAMLADKDDDKGFINKLKQRVLMEAMSLYGALNLKSLVATPRIYTLLQEFVGNLGLLIKLEEFKTGENAGNLKGAQGLKKQFTPRAIKQITENIETGKKWQIILDRSKNEPIDDETKATFKEELKAYYEEELDKIKKSKEEVEFKTKELDKTIKNKITQFKNNQADLAAEKAFKKLKGLDPAERASFFNTLPESVQTRVETIIKNEKKKQLNN